jgi:hypothetical protein
VEVSCEERTLSENKEVKPSPLTDHGGLQRWEMLRIPHCLHNPFTDGGGVNSLTHRPRLFLLEAEKTPGPSMAGRIRLTEKFIHLIGFSTRDLLDCSSVTQPTALRGPGYIPQSINTIRNPGKWEVLGRTDLSCCNKRSVSLVTRIAGNTCCAACAL